MSYGSRKRGYDQGGFDLPSSPAYNVEPVTNTSSSSCANNGRRTPRWVLDARRRSSRLCFSHFVTRTVDNTVDLYADIRLESRFWLPHLHSTPLLGGGFPSEYRQPVWYGATRWWKNCEDMFICFDMNHERHRQTDTAWRQGPRYA